MALEETTPATEETVDHAGYAKFMQGSGAEAEGAGEEGNEESATPTPKVFTYRGRKITVTSDEELAALEEMRKEARGENGRLGSELAVLRDKQARLEGELNALRTPTKKEDDLQPPPADLARTDYSEYHARWVAYQEAVRVRDKEEILTKLNEEKTQERTKEQAAEAQRAWARSFYATHPDFDKPHLKNIVRDVYIEHVTDITEAGSPEEQYERLAELAAQRVAEIRKTPADKTTPKAPKLEGAGAPATKKDKEPDFVPVTGANWSARKRAEMRGKPVKKK
jgi:hypothetical protein